MFCVCRAPGSTGSPWAAAAASRRFHLSCAAKPRCGWSSTVAAGESFTGMYVHQVLLLCVLGTKGLHFTLFPLALLLKFLFLCAVVQKKRAVTPFCQVSLLCAVSSCRRNTCGLIQPQKHVSCLAHSCTFCARAQAASCIWP